MMALGSQDASRVCSTITAFNAKYLETGLPEVTENTVQGYQALSLVCILFL